jgi:glutathionyl-hydroquinone reductase
MITNTIPHGFTVVKPSITTNESSSIVQLLNIASNKVGASAHHKMGLDAGDR